MRGVHMTRSCTNCKVCFRESFLHFRVFLSRTSPFQAPLTFPAMPITTYLLKAQGCIENKGSQDVSCEPWTVKRFDCVPWSLKALLPVLSCTVSVAYSNSTLDTPMHVPYHWNLKIESWRLQSFLWYRPLLKQTYVTVILLRVDRLAGYHFPSVLACGLQQI